MEDKVRSESMDNNRFGKTIKIWITCIVILASILAFILMRFTRGNTILIVGLCDFGKTMLFSKLINSKIARMFMSMHFICSFFVVFQLFDIQTEAQPQLMKLLDLSILNEEITKQLNLSMMGVNEKQTEPLDLSVMGTDDEQTEVLDLSIPKVNIKEAADQCKLNKVMNDEQSEPSNVPIQEADEERKKKKKKAKKKCNVCGKEMAGNLKKHMLTHTGEKPYICSTCGRSFSLLWNLKIHMQIHNGVKPYSCSQCEKHFTRKSDLKRHMLIHTGEKSENCPQCKKNFTQKRTLTRHMRVHSRKVNVGKVARNSQSHRRSHADEKPCTAENV